ncbi:MAG: tRNA pseudouridine(55) synthase TruB [Deltaproteobacteria bacterium]|nr:tRNA pseudouridine(55) synthase TruB [Deltaproteobacteria bacterium]MBW2253207.1 tRNA pseudouridine(55) synthase TruB [Deltaproteobacteria bacterium]
MRPAFLVIDKPAGITSHDVVAAVRAVTGIAKVGHTGTLDPFATGALPLALGPATKLIQFVDESVKVYDAVIAFGAQTDTGDPSGKVVREAPKPCVDLAEVLEVVRGFVGERMQKPPAYSAVKKGGKPLYYYARKGEPVEVPARPITIHDIDVRHYDQDTLRVVIRCSRGTYARVLADEVAAALGSAGHLAALERPRSGPFYLEDAIDMARLAVLAAAEPGHTWEEVLLHRSRKGERVPWKRREEVLEALAPWMRRPLDVLKHLPLADLRATDARRVARGGPPPPPPPGCGIGDRYLLVHGDELIAVAESTIHGPSTLRVVGQS